MNNIIPLIDINKNLIIGKYARHMVTQLVKVKSYKHGHTNAFLGSRNVNLIKVNHL